jgi:hypothetical protein
MRQSVRVNTNGPDREGCLLFDTIEDAEQWISALVC